MKVYVDGIGLAAPGLAGWPAAHAVLQGAAPYRPAEMTRPTAELLPPAERRRCGEIVKLALDVGFEALTASGARGDRLPVVFTSSSGNGELLHEICETLARPERDLSPTRFHNSVHNASAGYWSIATGSHEPSTSLCAYHGSFAAGLLEAALQAVSEECAVALVACDAPHPEPLASVCSVIAPCSVALVVAAAKSAPSCATLDLTLVDDAETTQLTEPALEALRLGNAAARALPLLAAIACRRAERVVLEYLPRQCLAVTVRPCDPRNGGRADP